MTTHELHPERGSTTDVFDRSAPPVLTVDPGDTVVAGSLDAAGYLQRQRTPGEQRPRMFDGRRGHCLTGPIAVRGAEPGDVLAVHIVSADPGEWGWTVAGAADNALNRALGITGAPSWLLWEIDDAAGTATSDRGHTVRTSPFLGVIGMPPDERGRHSTITPRAAGGGNIDCRDLTAGATLFLPVTVPGALVHLGDGHAAQGDGEVAGTAIECPMTTRVTLDVVTGAPVRGVHAVTTRGRITFGFAADLNAAMVEALTAMVTWMQHLHDLDRGTATALASSVVDLRVTQVANETWGVHAVLPHGAVA
ncbi:acetamidase/formamidase family protein [Pseudonocardia humida]|uniref:Acetamidase/formamidase family protein n=1 Tax=Pseudonocardia humida TaxID=2800819 RepID=A0ABT1ACA4_9PSEU|nr:acetamidase/formamidase family protein [Pseudonocardia humida]MCO1660685.1 acetamidase/formamidase family protein [Pseudonocardia humida]